MSEIERLLGILPTAATASKAWEEYGEVIVCEDEAEMVAEADRIASEHVQVMTDRDDWFLENLTNYGALFLGPRTVQMQLASATIKLGLESPAALADVLREASVDVAAPA